MCPSVLSLERELTSAAPVAGSCLKEEFTEPVALLSTRPADLPLPRRTVGLSFDLLALRARCVEEPMGARRLGQGGRSSNWRSLRNSRCARCGGAMSDLCQIRVTIVGASRRMR
jgi:hypothetical protein